MGNKLGNKSNLLKTSKKIELAEKFWNTNNEYSFKELAEMYNISYATSRKICWTYKYKGKEALISQTGKNKKKKNKIK